MDLGKSCQESCDDVNCGTACIENLTACNDACPCMEDCPLGCLDCDHDMCKCDPETDEQARICLNKYEAELLDCIGKCDMGDQDKFKSPQTFNYLSFYQNYSKDVPRSV